MMRRFVISLLFLMSITMAFAEIKHLTKQEFLDKIWNYEANATEWEFRGERPCVIDFYASWCGPCKAMAPILEDLAVQYAGKIDIYKVNTEVERELSAAWGIRSIPTFLFCPMSDLPQMTTGAMSKDALVKAINDVLLK